jgi:predicted 3-demethylubiquinone-9 3-methyltransferase (glyoxalase superfamily)
MRYVVNIIIVDSLGENQFLEHVFDDNSSLENRANAVSKAKSYIDVFEQAEEDGVDQFNTPDDIGEIDLKNFRAYTIEVVCVEDDEEIEYGYPIFGGDIEIKLEALEAELQILKREGITDETAVLKDGEGVSYEVLKDELEFLTISDLGEHFLITNDEYFNL